MILDEQASSEIHDTLRKLIVMQKRENIDENIAAAEALIFALVDENRLSFTLSVPLIDCLLYLWRAHAAKAVINYIIGIKQGDDFLERVASYLVAERPTREDVIKAQYCLRSLSYDILYNQGIIQIKEAISKIIRRIKIEKLDTVVDLGCGAGLVGDLLRSFGFSGTLIGVDFSDEMLKIARIKGKYSSTYCGSAHDFLNSTSTGSFDAAFFTDLAPLLELDSLTALLEVLFEKVACRGPIVFNLPMAHDFRPSQPTTTTVEPVLRAMRVRYTAIDNANRRYYCCQR